MKQPVQKLSLAICAMFVFSGAIYAQQIATTGEGRKVMLNADGTWKYADASISGVTLKIEAGIVYKTGGPQPVARTTFYLLDTFPLDDIEKIAPTMGYNFKNGAEEFIYRCGEKPEAAREIIRQHVRYTLTTGFDGKAELPDIKPGKYWLFGSAQTRAKYGCALWMMQVDLTKSIGLTLDQNNAVEAR